MKNPYRTLSSRITYKNPWITVREDKVILPNGQPGMYGVVETAPTVFVVAVSDGQVYLQKMFRYPVQAWGLEVCSGSIDKGEEPLVAGKRELMEETGLTAEKWKLLGAYHAVNGYADTHAYFYLVEEITEDSTFQPPAAEAITEIIKVPLSEVEQLISNGQISDGQSAFALLLVLQRLRYHEPVV